MGQPEPEILVTTTNWYSYWVGSPVDDGEDVTAAILVIIAGIGQLYLSIIALNVLDLPLIS